eukprot:2565946-Pleurochrysis_carterae.AAC.5
MSALASTFKCHLQLANDLLTCRLVVLFKTFHLLTVSASLNIACEKAWTTAMPFNSRSKSATSAKKMRMDVALVVAVKGLSTWTSYFIVRSVFNHIKTFENHVRGRAFSLTVHGRHSAFQNRTWAAGMLRNTLGLAVYLVAFLKTQSSRADLLSI